MLYGDAISVSASRARGGQRFAAAMRGLVYIDRVPHYYDELAEELDISKKTLAKRLAKLRAAGVKITKESLKG